MFKTLFVWNKSLKHFPYLFHFRIRNSYITHRIFKTLSFFINVSTFVYYLQKCVLKQTIFATPFLFKEFTLLTIENKKSSIKCI